MEPDIEALGVAQPWELAPGEEECLLDGVLRPLHVPEDPERDGVAPIAVQVDELGEGALVASPRQLDQPRPHGFPPTAPDRSGASLDRDGPTGRKVQLARGQSGRGWSHRQGSKVADAVERGMPSVPPGQ